MYARYIDCIVCITVSIGRLHRVIAATGVGSYVRQIVHTRARTHTQTRAQVLTIYIGAEGSGEKADRVSGLFPVARPLQRRAADVRECTW